MIPKKIHYCWFGRGELPEDARRCIESWRKFCPDYEIIEWNEDNFDVNSILYTRQAYEARKYAFVSDYARFKILHEHGGIYFDTDVEVIRPFDDIVERGPFMGYETDPDGLNFGTIAPGLCIGALPKMDIFKKIIQHYKSSSFLDEEGRILPLTVVNHNTKVFKDEGLSPEPGIQTVAGVTIYPSEYFNPLDDATGRLHKTPNTHSIHWFSKSWCGQSKFRIWISRMSHRILGTDFPGRVRRIFKVK